ncbi:MAG: NADH-quinone oxidoreductase subunit J [Thermaerobacter sp.]|nr:NADH-quinone oxidoreductase subunit J [Thermaerobacter sp.]
MLSSVVFWLAAAVAIVGAGGVLLARNPVHSALSLVVNLAALGVLFLLLHAEFLAVVEILVYAGAVMVLFLFVVTLLMAGTKTPKEEHRFRLAYQFLLAGLFGFILLVLVAHVMLGADWISSLAGPNVGSFGSIAAFGTALFTQYLLPFELTAVVLLVAVIGVIVLGREHGANR